jgi:hypothetical protein
MAKRRRQTLIQQSRGISSQQKAQWHEIDGAGRSHVKRPFFGLNAKDEDAVVDRISQGLDEALKETR